MTVATRIRDHGQFILNEDLKLIPFNLGRRGMLPWVEFMTFVRLAALYRRERPDVVHHVSLKPVVYGTLAARIVGVPCVINAVTGLGHVFTSNQWPARILRFFIQGLMKIVAKHPNSRLIVQNVEDQHAVKAMNMMKEEHVALIRGSGVNIKQFTVTGEPDGTPVVAMVSRMLWSKGVGVFADAVGLLRARNAKARFVLVGFPDSGNPDAVTVDQINQWVQDGIFEWWGRLDNIPAVWAKAHVAVLPTYYGEGVPKTLLEAAACGRPIVTTDIPGCRDIVHHGENGLLVPPKNPQALAEGLQQLIKNPSLRIQMGAKGRQRVEDEFSDELVVNQTLALYKSVLGNRWPS